ncbi:MAG: cation-translocating P-type ATPase, partial [Deltaproteobacteria bacterium]|nr:cation-translocating P-type ATPase [Deltaproteobacteria bacterium]
MSSTDEPRVCILCQTPIPELEGPDARFCCAGCERVHEVLTHLDDSAREAYVEAARRMGIIPAGPDDEAAVRRDETLPTDPSAVCEERFVLGGLACPSCAWVAEQVLSSQRGVERVETDFFSGTAKIGFDLRLTTADELRSLLSPLGYRLAPLRDEARSKLSRSATLQFAIAAVITMNIMALASVRYFEGHGLLDQAPEFLVWLELVLTLPVLVIGWLPILRRALVALRSKRVTADLLIGTAVGAATFLSVGALLTGRDDIYFETCAGLVTITLLSQMIEAHLRSRAFGRLAGLLKMRVTRARRL